MIRFSAFVALLLLPGLLLSACATVGEYGAGRCDAKRVQAFVGALGTKDLGTAALNRSGAKTMRWIGPAAMVTMDYRSDRLNIRVDPRNFVKALDCG